MWIRAKMAPFYSKTAHAFAQTAQQASFASQLFKIHLVTKIHFDLSLYLIERIIWNFRICTWQLEIPDWSWRARAIRVWTVISRKKLYVYGLMTSCARVKSGVLASWRIMATQKLKFTFDFICLIFELDPNMDTETAIEVFSF